MAEAMVAVMSPADAGCGLAPDDPGRSWMMRAVDGPKDFLELPTYVKSASIEQAAKAFCEHLSRFRPSAPDAAWLLLGDPFAGSPPWHRCLFLGPVKALQRDRGWSMLISEEGHPENAIVVDAQEGRLSVTVHRADIRRFGNAALLQGMETEVIPVPEAMPEAPARMPDDWSGFFWSAVNPALAAPWAERFNPPAGCEEPVYARGSAALLEERLAAIATAFEIEHDASVGSSAFVIRAAPDEAGQASLASRWGTSPQCLPFVSMALEESLPVAFTFIRNCTRTLPLASDWTKHLVNIDFLFGAASGHERLAALAMLEAWKGEADGDPSAKYGASTREG